MKYEIWNQAVLVSHRRASLVVDIHCHQFPSAIYAHRQEDVDVGVASGLPNVIHTRGSDRPFLLTGACRMVFRVALAERVRTRESVAALRPERYRLAVAGEGCASTARL